jgi:hypothetical protein
VSFAEIETAARKLMAAGQYPSVATVRQELRRGSTTTIADAMRRFWKDQAALNAGDPVALSRLPPEFADAAVNLWEQALRLSLQTANQDDSAGRAKLEGLKRDTDARARSLELREKEWDMAARVREQALADTREQVNLLLRQLSNATGELHTRDARIGDLQGMVDQYRAQITSLIAAAIVKNRTKATSPTKPRTPSPAVAKQARKSARDGLTRSAGSQRPKTKAAKPVQGRKAVKKRIPRRAR